MLNAILELLKLNIKNGADLMRYKRKIAKKHGIPIFQNSEVLKVYQGQIKKKLIKPDFALERILRKRAVRTMSGIAPVAVLTKPYPCPGKCAYCPTEKDVPQSYLSNEPAVMRAIRCNYDPYVQVQMRLRALEANGHKPEKIELIVIGGTWSALPEEYKYWYIGECFRGANDYNGKIPNPKSQITNKFQILNSKFKINKLVNLLKQEQNRNEKMKYKIIGVTLETRPDYIDEKELLQMRELGCTRVELGVQAVDDKILKLNKRGHGVAEIARATELLKNFGFKVTYHIMPGLPGSTAAKDLKMFKQLFTPLDKLKTLTVGANDKNKDKKIYNFINDKYSRGSGVLIPCKTEGDAIFSLRNSSAGGLLKQSSLQKRHISRFYLKLNNECFQPDQIKFYPTVVTRGSLLYKWWKAGKYKPYSDKVLRKLIIDCKKVVPEYVRIIRLIRDIPGESIIAGNKTTNLRQVMKDAGVECRCIRCREAGDKELGMARGRSASQAVRPLGKGSLNLDIENTVMVIRKYAASGGEEYFISYESKDGKILYGFCRLRLSGSCLTACEAVKQLKSAALIRELHVYGELVPVGGDKKVQHSGLGKKLMIEAEKIARLRGYEKMAVISGIGARGYYRKLGYRLKKSYMVKRLGSR